MSPPVAPEQIAKEAERRYALLLEGLRREFPGFRLVRKRVDPLSHLIHVLLCGLTLGRMRGYLTRYQTTIGRTIYLTDDWDRLPALSRYATLRHEAVHLRQFRRFGLLGMTLLYLLVPLPFGLAWFRMRLEREAYEETLRAIYEIAGEGAVRDPALRAGVIAQFTSPAYGWMWPFPRSVQRWYDSFLARLVTAPRGAGQPRPR